MASTYKIEEGDSGNGEKDLTERLSFEGIDSTINQLVSNNEVLMFSKSTCAYCFGF